MTWYAWFQTALAVIGTISSGSFVVIAVGDSLVQALDALARVTDSPAIDEGALQADRYWTKAKAIWNAFRPVIDRLSIYSRPKEPK
jgi:hypothetical protein